MDYVLIAYAIIQINLPWTEGGTATPHLPVMNIVAEFNTESACNFAKRQLDQLIERSTDPRLPSFEGPIMSMSYCFPNPEPPVEVIPQSVDPNGRNPETYDGDNE